MATSRLQIIITAVDRASKAFRSTGLSMEQLGQKAMRTGTILTGLSVVAGVMIVKSAANLEQSVANAVSVTGKFGDAAEKAKKQISDLARVLGKETVFTAGKAADAMYVLASAGLDVANMTKEDLLPILNLASATQSDLEFTTIAMNEAIAQMGLTFKDSARVADVFGKAIGSSQLKLETLSNAMTYAAPVAKGFGMTLEETVAILGKLADAGFKGSMGGTALRGALVRLSKPTKQITDIFEKYKITLDSVNPLTQKFTDIIQTLKDAGINAADAMTIFGQRAGPGMLALMTEGSEAINQLEEDLINAGGTVQRMAEIQLATFNSQMEQVKSSLEEVAIEIGENWLPKMREMVTMFKNWINEDTKMIAKQVETTIKITLMVGAFLLLIGIISKTIIALYTITGALAGFSIAMGMATVATSTLVAAIIAIPALIAITITLIGLAVVINGLIKLKKQIDAIKKSEEETTDMRIKGFEKYKKLLASENEDVRRYAQLKIDSLHNQFAAIDGYARRQSQAHRDQISQLEEELIMRSLLVRQGNELVELTGYQNDAMMSYGTGIDLVGEAGVKAFADIANETGKASKETEKLIKEYEKVLDAIKDLQKQETALKISHAKKQLDFKMRYAEAYVGQEETIARLTEQIASESDAKRKAELEVQLAIETAVLDSRKTILIAYEQEIENVRKDNALTDFERTINNIALERIAYQREFQNKLSDISIILREEQAKADAIIDMTDTVAENSIAQSNAVANVVIANIDKQIAKENELFRARQRAGTAFTPAFGGMSMPFMSMPFAKGGIVTKPTLGMLGEAGPEAVIPLNKVGGLGMIFNFDFRGSLFGSDAAEEVGDVIIDRVKENIRI